VISGDEITIEYFEPADAEFPGELGISKVYHAYRNVIGWLGQKDGQFGASGSCNIDINCPEGSNWQDEKNNHPVIKNRKAWYFINVFFARSTNR